MFHVPDDDLVYRTIVQTQRGTDCWNRAPYACDRIHLNRENGRMDLVSGGIQMKMDGWIVSLASYSLHASSVSLCSLVVMRTFLALLFFAHKLMEFLLSFSFVCPLFSLSLYWRLALFWTRRKKRFHVKTNKNEWIWYLLFCFLSLSLSLETNERPK